MIFLYLIWKLFMHNTNISPHIIVPKGWGHEVWICNNEKYCGKFLVFEPNKKCSIHFHEIKDEVLYVDQGKITLLYSWTSKKEDFKKIILTEGMSFHIPTGLMHQMIAGNKGARIIEFSTHHEDSDSIRIEKGD